MKKKFFVFFLILAFVTLLSCEDSKKKANDLTKNGGTDTTSTQGPSTDNQLTTTQAGNGQNQGTITNSSSGSLWPVNGGTDQVIVETRNFSSYYNLEEQFCNFAAKQAVMDITYKDVAGTGADANSQTANIAVSLKSVKKTVTLPVNGKEEKRVIEVGFEVVTFNHPAISQTGKIKRPSFGQSDATGYIEVIANACSHTASRKFYLTVPAFGPDSDTSLDSESLLVFYSNGYLIFPASENLYKVMDGTTLVGISAKANAPYSKVIYKYGSGAEIQDPSSIHILEDSQTTINLFVMAPDGTSAQAASIKIEEPVISNEALLVSSNVRSEYEFRKSIQDNDEDKDGSPLSPDNYNWEGYVNDTMPANTNTPRLKVEVANTSFVQEINTESIHVIGFEGTGLKVQEIEGISRLDDHTIEILLTADGEDETSAIFGHEGAINWPDYGDKNFEVTVEIDGSQFVNNDGNKRTGIYTFEGFDEQPTLEWVNGDENDPQTASSLDGILNGEALRLILPNNFQEVFEDGTDFINTEEINQLNRDSHIFNDPFRAAEDVNNYRILVFKKGDTENLMNKNYGIGINPTSVKLVDMDSNRESKIVELVIGWNGTEINEDLDFYVEVFGGVFKYSQKDELSTKVTLNHIKDLNIAIDKNEHSLDGAEITATLNENSHYFFDTDATPETLNLEWQLSGTGVSLYNIASFSNVNYADGTDDIVLIAGSDIEIVDERTAKIKIRWDGKDFDENFQEANLVLTIKDNDEVADYQNGWCNIDGLNLNGDNYDDFAFDCLYVYDFNFDEDNDIEGTVELNYSTGLSSNVLKLIAEEETLEVELVTPSRHKSVDDLTEENIDTIANKESAVDSEDNLGKGFNQLPDGELQMILIRAKLIGAIWNNTEDNKPGEFGLFKNEVDGSDLVDAPDGYSIDSVSRIDDHTMEVRVKGSTADFDEDFKLVLGVKGTAYRHEGSSDGTDHIINKGSKNNLGEKVEKIDAMTFRTWDEDGDLYVTDNSLLFKATKEYVTLDYIAWFTEKELSLENDKTKSLSLKIKNDKWSRNISSSHFRLVRALLKPDGTFNDCAAGTDEVVSGEDFGVAGFELNLVYDDSVRSISQLQKTDGSPTFFLSWDSINGDIDTINRLVSKNGKIYLNVKIDKAAFQDNESDQYALKTGETPPARQNKSDEEYLDDIQKKYAIIEIQPVDEIIYISTSEKLDEKGLDTANRYTSSSPDNLKGLADISFGLKCSTGKVIENSDDIIPEDLPDCDDATNFELYDSANWNFSFISIDTDIEDGNGNEINGTETGIFQKVFVKMAVLDDYDTIQKGILILDGLALTSGKGNENSELLKLNKIAIPVFDPVGKIASAFYSPNGTFGNGNNIDLFDEGFLAEDGAGTLGGLHEYMLEDTGKVKITFQLPTMNGDSATNVKFINNPGISSKSVKIDDFVGLDTWEAQGFNDSRTDITVIFSEISQDPADNSILYFNAYPADLENYGDDFNPSMSESEIIRMPEIPFIAQDTTD